MKKYRFEYFRPRFLWPVSSKFKQWERYFKNNLKPHLDYLDINMVLLQNVASHNINVT